MSAGGQGAPLAPAFHAAMLGQTGVPRVVLNLGGIANITVIAGDGTTPLSGFDTGTASCLLDAWAQENIGERYDANGAFAARGTIDEALLARLLDYPYFSKPPPKSTGREEFHPTWLKERLRDFKLAPEDVQATLLAFSARTIADAIRRFAPSTHEVLACGGGVHNPVLMNAIANELKPISVRSIGDLGIDPDFVEAMTFAWLALRASRRPRRAERVHRHRRARSARARRNLFRRLILRIDEQRLAFDALEGFQRGAERGAFARVPRAAQHGHVMDFAIGDVLAAETQAVTEDVQDHLVDRPVAFERDDLMRSATDSSILRTSMSGTDRSASSICCAPLQAILSATRRKLNRRATVLNGEYVAAAAARG